MIDWLIDWSIAQPVCVLSCWIPAWILLETVNISIKIKEIKEIKAVLGSQCLPGGMFELGLSSAKANFGLKLQSLGLSPALLNCPKPGWF